MDKDDYEIINHPILSFNILTLVGPEILYHVCLSVCLSVPKSICLYVHLYVYLLCLFLTFFLCLFAFLSVCPSIFTSVCPFICLYVFTSACPSVSLSVCLYIIPASSGQRTKKNRSKYFFRLQNLYNFQNTKYFYIFLNWLFLLCKAERVGQRLQEEVFPGYFTYVILIGMLILMEVCTVCTLYL